MKKILFIINSLTIGGSEKSLISLLNNIDYSKYEVDLLMFKKGEDFDKYIPKEVNVLEELEYYKFLHGKSNKNILKQIIFSYYKIKTSINLRFNIKKKKIIQAEQVLYNSQKNMLEKQNKKYDVALAYSQGMPTYYLIDKIKSDKKIAWINCDYKMTGYDKRMDYNFYKKIDKIVAVSQYSKESIVSVSKEYEKKTEIILDIVDPKLIESMADEKNVFEDKSYVNICTVARLITHYKGYDMAIKTAQLLKDSGYKFRWYAVGEGADRYEIENMIDSLGLKEEFILLGKKENPYPYMKNCDIYVQPSRNEGFGLTVAEAKILKKPIICTNFETAKTLISSEKDGLIVDIDEFQIYLGIKRYLENKKFKDSILDSLEENEKYNSLQEINKFYELVK